MSYTNVIRYLIMPIMLLCLGGITSSAYSQLNPTNLTKYSATEGNNINAVISDQYGFIWLATANGLIRFDGNEFTRYYNDPNDSTSISQILISSLFEDSKGRIWIGSVDDINVYNPATGYFTSYPFGYLFDLRKGELPSITTITENSNGTIYFGVQSYYGIPPIAQGILYYDEEHDSIHKVSGTAIEKVNDISSSTSDLFGNSWFSGTGSLVQIDEHGNSKNISLPTIYHDNSTQYPVIHSDNDGMIWMSYEHFILFKYNPKTETYQEYRLTDLLGTEPDELMILSIHSDSRNRIWLATNKGIYFFDESESLLNGFEKNAETLLQKSIVSNLDFDGFGNIWFGTYSNGLFKYEEKSYFQSVKSSLNTESEITPGWVNAFFESSDGTIWFSTAGYGDQSGLNKIDPQTGNFSRYPYSELFDNPFGMSDIDSLSGGDLLVSTYSGLFSLDTKSMTTRRIETPGITDSIAFINKYHKDRLDTEWIATAIGLFERRSGQSTFTLHDLSKLDNGMAISNEVMNIVESERNGIWILTNFGLYNADPETGKITRHGYDPDRGDVFISQDINSIFDDNNGTVWIGTWQGGLSQYQPETGEITNFTRSDGLASMGIQYILHDQNQNDLWLSTFEGLSKFSIPTKEVVNFTTDDGIHSHLFADGSGLKTKDGHFFFGGSGGYTFFTPENIIQKSIPPKISLTGLKVSNKQYKFEHGIQQAKHVELMYHENTISIGFAAIHYSNPSRNKVRYILNNYDSEWHESGNQHFAYYPNLPPGNYQFEVIAANSNGIWTNEGAAIEIEILPPWWRTWFAYGFYVFMLIGGIVTVDQYQRKRLIRKERDRARQKELEQAKKIEKAYHNLEVAHEDLKAAQNQLVQQEKLASLGQLTAGIAHEIKNPLNFVNNFSELSVELIEEAREELAALGRRLSNEEDVKKVDEALHVLNDIETNLKKIHEHGSRADTIVKSMLQHSRGGTREMEPTPVNPLVKEYVNLAYHGMRAGKDPITVDIQLDLDHHIGEVKMIAEDFSRVIVNLCNNAFDAMREKLNTDFKNQHVIEYHPKLIVRTRSVSNGIRLEVEDNGPGIPKDVKNKIMQPFFTTKKGTEGTGLGLSITNDIVKAHGGTIEVTSIPGQTIFTISLSG